MYSTLVKKLGLPIAEKIKRWPMSNYLAQLEESQWWTPGQLQAMQEEKMRAMIRHAYDSVEYYRSVFDERGLKPDDIKTLDDLPKLPILNKDSIRANFPDRIVSNKHDVGSLILGKSSGSTGEPLRYYLTHEEKAFKWACLYRMWRWAGYDFGKKYAIITVYTPSAFKNVPVMDLLERKVMRCLTLQTRDLNSDTVAGFVEAIQDFKPVILKGNPSTCYYIARYMKEHGSRFDVGATICNAETLVPCVRDYVQDVFGCGIYDTYGLEGMEAAAQCSPTSLHHLAAEAVIAEVVDENGDPLPPGTEGRLVLTALDKWAMPFIRYDTQDVAAIAAGACSCGRGLPLISNIKGRLVDIGVTPSGKFLSVFVFSPLFRDVEGVDAWQVVQESPQEVSVNVKPTAKLTQETLDGILREIQDYVGDDVRVAMNKVDDIPLTPSGKRRFFISKCPIDPAEISSRSVT